MATYTQLRVGLPGGRAAQTHPEPGPSPPSRGLTDSEAKGVEGVPIDAVQLAHQGSAELHHDADVGVLPLQVLWDRALHTGPRAVSPRLPTSRAPQPREHCVPA